MSVNAKIEEGRKLFEETILQNYNDAKSYRNAINPLAVHRMADRNSLFKRNELGYESQEINALWVAWNKVICGHSLVQ